MTSRLIVRAGQTTPGARAAGFTLAPRRSSGFMLIELMIVVAVIAIISAIAIPNLLEARKSGNESAAIGALRTIVTAQAMFREGDRDSDGVLQYATDLQQLLVTGIVDAVLASGAQQGYRFTLGSAELMTRWHAQADPAVPCETGDRYLFVDETGRIRFRFSGPAGPLDPELGSAPPAGDAPRCAPNPTPQRSRAWFQSLTRFINPPGPLPPSWETAGGDLVEAPGLIPAVLGELDQDHDRRLTFQEVLQANPLAIARTIRPQLFPKHNGDVPIGPDPVLTKSTGAYLGFVERFLRLGVANETELPALVIDGRLGLRQVVRDPQQAPPPSFAEILREFLANILTPPGADEGQGGDGVEKGSIPTHRPLPPGEIPGQPLDAVQNAER